jgi:hypothetical protein
MMVAKNTLIQNNPSGLVKSRRGVAAGKSALPFLPEVNQRKLRRELKLDKLAKSAQRNGATSKAEVGEIVESRLSDHLNTLHEKGVGHFEGRIKHLKGMVSRYAGAFDTEPLETSLEGTIQEIEQETQRHGATLERLRDEFDEADMHYQGFRQKHGLKRPPDLSSGLAGALPIFIIMMVIEAGANMFFFSPGSNFGLLGGFFYSLVISVLNIGGAALFGYAFFRWLNSRSWIRKFFGVIMALVFVAFLLTLNVVVGFYRSAFVTLGGEGNGNLLQTAIAHIKALDLSMLDEFSFAMMLIGITLGALACAKGARVGDAYPGYHRVYAFRENYRKRFEKEADELVEHLAELRDNALQDIEAFQKQARESIAPYREIGKEISELMARFDAFEAHLESVGNEVLGDYYDKNALTASKYKSGHFKHQWVLPGKLFAFGEPNSRFIKLAGDSVLGEIMNEGRIQSALDTAKTLRSRVLEAMHKMEHLFVARQDSF